jgi:RNA polymerase sigma-70 factor (ECF subfamily)
MLGERFDEVLGRARAGDELAFAELWRDTHPMLLRYLRVSAGPLAEDVASHTWLRVIEALGSFTGDEPGFRRWLVTIARNRFLDETRRASRRPERLVSDVVTLVDGWGLCAPDASSLAEEHLSTDMALRLIATLPREQAEMVMLRVVIGLGVADVAQVVGRTPGAVRVAVHRGLRKLGESLAGPSAPLTGPVTRPVTRDAVLAFPHRDA